MLLYQALMALLCCLLAVGCASLQGDLYRGEAARAAKPHTAGVVRFYNGYEHMYTASAREMDALRAAGYQTDGRVFEVLRAAISGTVALQRVRWGAYHIFSTSVTLLSLLQAGGGVTEAPLGFVFIIAQPGTQPLYSYADPRTQLRFLTLSRVDRPTGFVEDPYGFVAGYVYPSPKYKVGAYYFGMWSAGAYDPPNIAYQNSRFYRNQGDDPWLGVRTIHDALDLSAINQSDPYWQAYGDTYTIWYLHTPELKRKPAIGYYDQRQIATLEKHIAQATAYGLSYFNFYWYWDAQAQREKFADGLHSFLAASNTHAMQFMLSICAHGYFFSVVRSQIAEVTRFIAQSYFTKANYLKTSTGQPIVTLCDATGIMEDHQLPKPVANVSLSPTGPARTFLAALRAASMQATGQYPVILGRLDDPKVARLNDFLDGGTCILALNSWDYEVASASQKKTLEGMRGSKPFMPCVTQNFDERPRMGIIYYDPATFHVMQNYSISAFTNALAQTRYWMDTQTDEVSQYLTVYAWNEWHEGGIIEPSTHDGTAALEVIRQVFGLK